MSITGRSFNIGGVTTHGPQPTLVTSSLVLNLDAAVTSSLLVSGGAAILSDVDGRSPFIYITGNPFQYQVFGGMSNFPTSSVEGGGSYHFNGFGWNTGTFMTNGTSGSINIDTFNGWFRSNWTINLGFKVTRIGSPSCACPGNSYLLSAGSAGFENFHVRMNSGSANTLSFATNSFRGGVQGSFGSPGQVFDTLGKWLFLTVTFPYSSGGPALLYLNGVQVGSTPDIIQYDMPNSLAPNQNTTGNFMLFSNVSHVGCGDTCPSQGFINMCQIYTRVLSPAEVYQNWLAVQSRFDRYP